MRFFKLRRFITKWTHFEYWPWLFFYLPVIPFYLYYVIRSRYFFFNTAANPGIDLGGLFGESKIGILDHFDEEYKALTYMHLKGSSIEDTLNQISLRKFQMPLILKPNIGQRGDQVIKVHTIEEIREVLKIDAMDFLIQEYIDYEFEFGVLYGRIPGEEKGLVRSIVVKKFLKVMGDGKRNVQELLLENKRAWFQMERLNAELPELLCKIPQKDEEILIEPVGNHCKGTEFINANHLINETLHNTFDKISRQFDGFYYGRYDLKAKSIEEFQRGETIKMFELNGVTSDPGHIFDKDYRLIHAYRDIITELGIIYRVSKANINKGIKPYSTVFIVNLLWGHFQKRKKLGTLFAKENR